MSLLETGERKGAFLAPLFAMRVPQAAIQAPPRSAAGARTFDYATFAEGAHLGIFL